MTTAGLLDVNVLVALAWDSHVHHVAAVAWFLAHRDRGWATCPITEAGFVRVSANPRALPHSVAVSEAIGVLAALRALGVHQHLDNDVSMTDPDLPRIVGHRQVTDSVLLTVARRHGTPLVSFDRALLALGSTSDVTLLVSSQPTTAD